MGPVALVLGLVSPASASVSDGTSFLCAAVLFAVFLLIVVVAAEYIGIVAFIMCARLQVGVRL